MTDLEKRLIVLSHLGITIEHCNGHRYIYCRETEDFDFDRILNLNGVSLNNKIYGTLLDALDIIDYCLVKCNCKTLLDNFWFDEFDISGDRKRPFDSSRVDLVERGKGGLV